MCVTCLMSKTEHSSLQKLLMKINFSRHSNHVLQKSFNPKIKPFEDFHLKIKNLVDKTALVVFQVKSGLAGLLKYGPRRCCGSRLFIPDPNFYDLSIPEPTTTEKGKNCKIILFLNRYRTKIYWANWQRIKVTFFQKIVRNMGWESGIRYSEKILSRIRNTGPQNTYVAEAWFYLPGGQPAASPQSSVVPWVSAERRAHWWRRQHDRRRTCHSIHSYIFISNYGT